MVRQIQNRNENLTKHTSAHLRVFAFAFEFIFFHISNKFECYGILKISYAIKFYYNRIIEKWGNSIHLLQRGKTMRGETRRHFTHFTHLIF